LTREETVLNMATEYLSKMPPEYVEVEVQQGLKALGATKPLTIVLKQEIDRLNKVLKSIKQICNDLKLAIAGTIVMNENLSLALDSLFLTRVPPIWTKTSDLVSPNMGVWFTNILTRAVQLTGWIKNGRPMSFWLTGLFNGTGFLTANRQEVCRKHAKEGWALDDVVSASEVTKYEREEVKKGPEEGVYVYGLFLEGCRWDKEKMRLADSEPKVIYAPLPVIHLNGVLASQKKTSGQYDCPLYRNPKRTGLNFISSCDLKIEEAQTKWILRGVCLLCSKE